MESQINEKQLKFFADFIEKQLGIVYTETNFFQLEHRLNDIAVQLGMENSNALYVKAQGGITGMFKDLLLDLATNNETSFFRDPGVFAGLETAMIPSLRALHPEKRTFNIWSAASSTGQEVYSIVMTFDQAKQKDASVPGYEILATDFSERVLKRAKEGKYSQLEVQRGLPARLMLQYFDKVGDTDWALKDSFKRGISFRQINLLDPWTRMGVYEIIFCRNVLIYQNVQNKIDILNRMTELLVPGGILILGAAESLVGLSDRFEQVPMDRGVFYRKKV